jgi:hypothetical protein
MNTWSHLCTTDNAFYTLDIKQECKVCGLNHKVQSVRFEGYAPAPLIKRKEEQPIRKRLAALFMPKRTIDENQHDYYDRHG